MWGARRKSQELGARLRAREAAEALAAEEAGQPAPPKAPEGYSPRKEAFDHGDDVLPSWDHLRSTHG
jgi:hypothetical protein